MTQSIEFGITVPQGEIAATDIVIMNVHLTNVGDESVYVNSRFAVAPKVGDVQLKIEGPQGEVPFPFRIRLQPLSASDFVKLDPDQSVVAGVNLTKRYRLTQPGRYTIEAEYVNEKVPAPLEKATAFTGKLKAEPTTLELG